MIKQREHFHGSDLEKIEQVFRIKKEDITSFSANVNPLGISYKLRETLANHIDAITSYPDREYASLRKSIGSYVGTDMENILVGNGSTELISIFIQYIKPKKAILLAPTYSEYEREITLAGGICEYHFVKEENNFILDKDVLLQDLTDDVNLLIICNPNNPTSVSIPNKTIAEILSYCETHNIFVLIDETYVEFAPDMEQVTSIPLTKDFKNLIILRGVSKFFASPGLRLGYAICSNQEFLKLVNEKKNPWTINSLAAIAGEIMFTDTEYIAQTKNLIFSERKKCCDRMKKRKDLKVYEPTANFVLVKILNDKVTAYELFEECIKKCLMIRDCSTFKSLDDSFFRFCFMMPEKNEELLDVIFEYLDRHE